MLCQKENASSKIPAYEKEWKTLKEEPEKQWDKTKNSTYIKMYISSSLLSLR